ncbi:MAG: bifunctional phosphoribosylaminoimidazolecarboxamide formyltransferase/IMP cyclohydrolase, partial [Thermodesulfovibrionia bacterium]|nr:bifunctional phosphoribosylaminoimidazolecarboxamide formyltransferase/IMP cyclohydrolase [Thermodesulfovibrionia bacterium]
MVRVQRALISVSDKRDIVEFVQGLKKLDMEIISTGGTASTLRNAKLKVRDVSDYTKFPEMLGGRVKTLHPKIHGGLLWRRDNPKDKADTEANKIESIDLVVVNLYPFEETVSKSNVAFEDAIENIDIGGPTMLRSAAKNFKDVTVIVDPADYPKVLDELVSHNGTVSYDTKFYLAKKVFAHTARYDALIANYLERYSRSEEVFPVYLNLSYLKVLDLRYGENPHQKAALYRESLHRGLSLVDAKILQGKAMSFNNYLDSSAALDLAKEFQEPATVIVKHNNPCGVALGKTLHESYKKSFETD